MVYFVSEMSKEIQRIIDQIDSQNSESPAILATVVELLGSGYRLPGAKMLITENGEAFGTVSGGCLESDVLERAKKVLDTGEAEVLTYDTTGNDESVFSLNMGCNGVVRILIEPFRAESILVNSWKNAIQKRERQTVGTIISGGANLKIGGRVFYSVGEQLRFESAPQYFENSDAVKKLCVDFFNGTKSAETVKFKCKTGCQPVSPANEVEKFEIFFENVDPPLNLVIFGAGFDAIPLAKFAKSVGWRVSIVDHRPAFASRERFPKVDEIVQTQPEELFENLAIDDLSIAVLMTHNYQKDREIMRHLLNFDLKYIGMLGPKRRTETLLDELKTEGVAFSESTLNNVYAPIGLDIGADTPEAIAISIIAEIKSVLRNRRGGFLRDRDGSIYGRDQVIN